jgi:hypothetical protein
MCSATTTTARCAPTPTLWFMHRRMHHPARHQPEPRTTRWTMLSGASSLSDASGRALRRIIAKLFRQQSDGRNQTLGETHRPHPARESALMHHTFSGLFELRATSVAVRVSPCGVPKWRTLAPSASEPSAFRSPSAVHDECRRASHSRLSTHPSQPIPTTLCHRPSPRVKLRAGANSRAGPAIWLPDGGDASRNTANTGRREEAGGSSRGEA